MARIMEWKLARQWLIDGGVIPPIHPATKPSTELVDFARCLRDGVFLCVTLNKMKPNCVRYTGRPQMQLVYVRNINAFLTACHNHFGIPEAQLFEEGDLYNVTDFEKVVLLLSKLSKTTEAQALGWQPFPRSDADYSAEESIYQNLEELAWSSETIDENVYDVVPVDEEEDPYGDDSIYAAICQFQMPTSISAATSGNQDEKKLNILMELYETEKSFLEVLNLISDKYYQAMKPHLPQEDIELLFLLPQKLCTPHNKLLEGFQTCSQTPVTDVAQYFLNEQQGLLQYGTYAAALPMATKKAKQLQASKGEIAKVLQETLNKSKQRFPLSDLLSVPMQRILKYPLLLQLLLKCAEKKAAKGEMKNLSTALETLQDIAKYVNETKRDFESQKTISEIEQSMSDLKANVLCHYGRFHLDGELKVKSDEEKESKKKWIFLFDKSLVLCKKRLGLGPLKYHIKDTIDTQHITVKDMPNQLSKGGKGTFPFRITAPLGTCTSGPLNITCYAHTGDLKKQWMEGIGFAKRMAAPQGSKQNNHEFELETFDGPQHCHVCKKLLWGTFFQGYQCLKCKTQAHMDCLIKADPCKEMQNGGKLLSVKPHVAAMRENRSPISLKKGAIFVAKERFDNPLLVTVHGALMLVRGEEVEVISNSDPDWWEVISLRSGNRGRVPPSYLKQKDERSSFPPRGSITRAPPSPKPPSPENSLKNHTWFVGRMSRLDAESIIGGLRNSSFLIRESDQRPGEYAIALRWQNMPRHIRISKHPTGKLYVSDAKDFSSIEDLVEYYQHNSLGASFPEVSTTLKFPYWEVAKKKPAELLRRPTSSSDVLHNHPSEVPRRTSVPVDNMAVRRTSSPSEIPVSPPLPSRQHIHEDRGHWCEVLYDFVAEFPGELSMKRNWKIKLLSKETDRDRWWLGEYQGRTGLFPSNFVKELKEVV